MYLGLIDTVSKIVKTYGIDILSDPKFWHILSDTYAFGNEYALKDSFKRCVANGYISKLITIKGNSKKTKATIAHIVDSEKKLNPGREKEYFAVLYSIAIAIGSCSRKDYSEWEQPKNHTAKKDTHKGNYPKFHSTKYSLSNVGCLIWGICAWILSTALYGLSLFGGFPLWLLIFIIGIPQLSYCSYLLHLDPNSKNDTSKSLGLPVIMAFFISDCIATGLSISRDLFLFLWSFLSGKAYLIGIDNLSYSSLWIWIEFDDVSGFFSFIVSLLLLFCIFSCFLGIVSNQFTFKRITFSISWTRVLISVVTIVLICSVAFYYLDKKNERVRDSYIKSKQYISDQNVRLHNIRKNKKVDLSFKGIRLGIDYATCIGYADSIFTLSDKGKRNYEIVEIKEYGDKSIAHFSRVIKGIANWDNQKVKLSIYEYNGKVGEIRVEPDNNSYLSGFSDYYRTLSLYIDKYGEPEKVIWSPMLQYFKEEGLIDKEYNWTYNYWRFKNGIIKLDFNSIIYQSDAVLSYITEQEVKKEQYENLIQQRRKREQEHLDSVAKEQARKDSALRKFSNDNAINEI